MADPEASFARGWDAQRANEGMHQSPNDCPCNLLRFETEIIKYLWFDKFKLNLGHGEIDKQHHPAQS